MPPGSEHGDRDSHSDQPAADRAILYYITYVVSVPVRLTCAALRSPVLYPLASVSYTAYLLQAPFYSHKLILQKGGGANDGWQYLGALCTCLGFGLLLSLLVERPCMNLLHMVDPFAQNGKNGGKGR